MENQNSFEKQGDSQKFKSRRLGFFSTIAVGFILSLYAALLIALVFGIRDGWLEIMWINLKGDGQANVLAAGVTALGLLSSAVILPFVFKDRISSLSDMIDRTERDLANLNRNTDSSLSKLNTSFETQLKDMQSKSDQKADESQELVTALYAAVTTLLGQGHVTDSNHARQIIDGLWEKAKFVCRERLDAKKYMWQSSREAIEDRRQMSRDYLDALETNNVVSSDEKQMLLELRALKYARTAPSPAQFGRVKELQENVENFGLPNEFNGGSE